MAIDLSKLSTEQLDKLFHIQAIVARQQEAQERVRVLREYYDGEHPVLLSDRQKEYIGKNLTDAEFAFAHNTIKSVIDTLRERLSVSGFTVNGAGIDTASGETATPATELAALMWSWWEANRFDAQQIRLHRRALRDGLAYVMVDYDDVNQRPRFTLHHVDDGVSGISRHRDPENPDIVLYDCKYWYTYNPLEPGATGKQRKTVYLPHEIRKYIQGGGEWNWQTVSDPGDEAWPIPWLTSDDKPLGIATVEFENPGGSEVAQIIGLQNALNKSWLDLLAAADAAGFPILVHENLPNPGLPVDTSQDDDDIEGDDEFIIAPGRMLDTDGKVYRIEGANLQQLIDTIHLVVETIAGISRTPQYYLRPAGGSDVPSGEALKQLESGLVSRAVERQLIFGQAWADVMTMAYKVAKRFGSVALPDVPHLKVQTLWQSAETRQELTDAQRGEIVARLGVPQEEIWELLGFSPEKIASWKATQRSDQAAAVATIAQAIQTQARAANNGAQNGVPVAQPPVNGNGARG